jgi:transcriptional regulator NrdR family protein
MKHIVKRAGHTEAYDNKKLYGSVYAACLAMREPVGTAEVISEKVVRDVEAWLNKKSEVLSNDIRRITAKHLYSYNPDAAYAYMHHRIIW